MSDEKSDNTKNEAAPEAGGLRTMATPLTPIAQQVGQHVMGALSQPNTVAVLTTITGSRTGQQVISIPLSREQMGMVNGYLNQVEESDEPEAIDCVGYHCVLPE